MIFQGCMIQAAVMVAMMTPRRMLMYLGNRQHRSLAQLMTLADRLVPICATTHVRPTKKAPQRPAGPSHWAAISSGSQMYWPYTTLDAEQQMMPKRPSTSWIPGRKRTCQYTPPERFRYRVKSGIFTAIVALESCFFQLESFRLTEREVTTRI